MLKVLTLRDVRSMVVRMLVFTMAASLLGVLHVPVTHASNPGGTPPCYDIAGKGKQVLVNGVPNSGVVDFDAADYGGNPSYQYEACVIDPSGVGTGTFELRGWAWDDNLGWISFYCGNEGLGFNSNLGQPCGSFTYGVTIDSATGKFGNYAWGDNVGWIKFDNTGSPGNPQMDVDTTKPACQGYVYSVKAGCPPHSKADTVAWSDNVGWLDFDGVVLPWYTLVKEIDATGILVTLSPDPSGLKKTDAATPVASGVPAAYTLNVHVKDKKNNPVDPGRYVVSAVPEWYDSVQKNQAPAVPPSPYDNSTCADASPAVTKTCASLPSKGAGTGDYAFSITSKAPTSNMNFDDKNGNGVQDAGESSFESFTAPSMPAVQINQLTLKDVLISIIDTEASGACAYGTGVTCDPIKNYPTPPGDFVDLKFKPRTEVTFLKDPTGNDKSININTGASGPGTLFTTAITGPDNVTLNAGISPDPGVVPYKFGFDSTGTGILDFTQIISSWTANSSTANFYAGVGVQKDPVTGDPVITKDYIPGEYIYSVVNDLADGVQYYSNKLPKVTGSLAVRPVAVLQGNVYSSGSAAISGVQAVRSLGDQSTNTLRDAIYRNVQSIIAGNTKSTPDDLKLYTNTLTGKFEKDAGIGGNLSTLLPDADGVPKVYLHYGNLFIGMGDPSHCPSSAPCDPGMIPATPTTWSGERTIIVIGGSVHVESDIYNDVTPGTAKPKLGIIALKDLAADPATQVGAGNVYINPGVTRIQANIFADGTLFPETSLGVNAKAEPSFTDSNDAQNNLKYKQLMIEGSVASWNTIGGAEKTPPTLGNGQPAGGTDPHFEASLYDLNYLRYYTGVVKRDAVTGDAICPGGLDPSNPDSFVDPATGLPVTIYDTPQGCLYSPVDFTNFPENSGWYKSAFTSSDDQMKKLGATYVLFDPPTATLPGFGAQTGGTQKQLPQ